MAVWLEGLAKVTRNLNDILHLVEGKTLKGLIRGGIIIRREMDKGDRRIPVDTGNLRASFFMVTAKGPAQGVQPPKFKSVSERSGRKVDVAEMASRHQKTQTKYSAEAKMYPHPVVILGFSASYAIPVHENMRATVNWNREQSGPKFFEEAVKKSTDAVVRVVAKEAKIPK